MGLVARALRPVQNSAPPMPLSPTGGMFAAPQGSYLQFARAYATNEIVASAIDLRAMSASEPHIIGRRMRRASPRIANQNDEKPEVLSSREVEEMRAFVRDYTNVLASKGMSRAHIRSTLVRNGFIEELPQHPLVKLLNNPNPFMSRGQLWAAVTMDRDIAGNAYVLMGEGPLGNVAELWRLRPDRVKVIPGGGYVAGYEYNAGTERVVFPEKSVMHFKTLNPLNDYYGMPPLMQLLARVDVDTYMRSYVKTFYERGGAPGSILALKQKASPEQKDEIRTRFRNQFGGQAGWHEMMILDNAEASYTQLGLTRGLRDALPKELDAVSEARIAMRFGIPGSILGLLIGYESSSYANKRQDWQVLWDITMTPLLSDFDDVLNLAITPRFGGIDEVLFDLSDIKALQEDVDKIHDRHRKNLSVGAESWEEARDGMGLDPEVAEGTFLIPSNMVPVRARRGVIEMPEPKQIPAPQDEPTNMIEVVHHSCGKKIATDVEGNPELFCWKCSVAFRPLEVVA